LYNGDSCEILKGLPDNSIGYSIFSPPFSSLYTYSNSERDLGNCKSDDDFYIHFKFIVQELFRVIQPGRLVSIHCMQIPAMKERDGYIGLKDFRGDLIRLFQSVDLFFMEK
jgi:DNA modification methylase